MPCCAAYDSTVEASASVKISPEAVVLADHRGVAEHRVGGARGDAEDAVSWPAVASSAWSAAVPISVPEVP